MVFLFINVEQHPLVRWTQPILTWMKQLLMTFSCFTTKRIRNTRQTWFNHICQIFYLFCIDIIVIYFLQSYSEFWGVVSLTFLNYPTLSHSYTRSWWYSNEYTSNFILGVYSLNFVILTDFDALQMIDSSPLMVFDVEKETDKYHIIQAVPFSTAVPFPCILFDFN